METIKGKTIMFCGSGNTGTGMLSARGVLRDLETISVYSSAWNCLYEEGFLPDEEAVENEGFRSFLLHVDDWEPMRLVVLNGEIVVFCDSLNGGIGVIECTDLPEDMLVDFAIVEY